MKAKLLARITFLGVLFFGVANGQQESLLPQVADSEQIRTTFVLFNPTGNAVSVILEVTDDDGNPLPIDLADLGTDSQFLINLAPGATRILQTNGTGDGTPGAAKVTATGNIGVSAIFSLFDGTGTFLTETGIGDSNVSTDFVLPVDVTGDFNTGVAIFNISGQAADLALTLCDSSGGEVASTEVEISAGGHLARFVAGATEFFPGVAELRGSLKVSSTQPVAALTLRQNAARLNLTSLPVVSRDSSQTEFILPHIADGPHPGGAIKMTFLLFSISDQTANIQLSLTNDAGDPFAATIGDETASEFAIQLEPGTAQFLETDASGGAAAALTTGAAIITSDQPIGVSGIFTLLDQQGAFLAETGIGDSPVQAASTVAVDEVGSTGVALFNPGDETVDLTLTLLDSEGNVVVAEGGVQPLQNGEEIISLGPKEHLARFVEELFMDADFGVSSVAIVGEAALLTLRQIVDPRLSFTAFPVGEGAFGGVANPAEGPALPKTVTNIAATVDQVVDVELPAGFILSGDITVPEDSFSNLVRAERTDGQVFVGGVDFFTGTYSIVLPAGTYDLSVCTQMAGEGETDFTQFLFEDQTPVMISEDTERDLEVPPVATRTVSGTINGLNKLPPSDEPVAIAFTSAQGRFGGAGEIAGDGSYSVRLLDGEYSVGVLVVIDEMTGAGIGVADIGELSVDGADIAGANFTIPDLFTLSGDVSNQDASPLNQAAVIAVDGTIFDFRSLGCFPFFAGASFVPLNTPYELPLVANRMYSVLATQTVLSQSGAQSDGDLTVPFPGRAITLAADRAGEDFVFPPLPSLVMITGQVTDAQGAPVEGASVSTFTDNLTNTPGAAFSRSTQTDASGNYAITVLSGVDYVLEVDPTVDTGFPFPIP